MYPIQPFKSLSLLLLICMQAKAQTPIVTVTTDYSPAPSGLNYSLGGNAYYYGNQSGTINNIQTVVGFSLPDGSYYYNVFVEGQIKIRRVDNPVVSGRRCLVWVEAVETPGNYKILLPYIDSMELFFNGQTLNKGTDNLFGNQGDGAGNNNNIERVDWIVQAGMTAANPAQSGFPIFERGADDAHDPFCVAAVTALDASGSPSAYGRIVRVATNQYGNMANSNLNWTILRKEEAEPLLYRTTAGVQKRGGVFISMADLGIAANAVIYGYSLFAHDLPPASTTATLLDYENATYFPLNTSSNTTLGGIDLIAIAGLYNITDDVVLPVALTRWHLEMHNREAVLNWVMQHKGERRFIEIEKSTDNKNWKTISRVPGSHQSFTDANIEKNNYYRLKVVSSSGRFFYSSTKQLSAEASAFFVSVLSKPKELSINIENAKGKKLTVSVYDNEGKNLVRQAVQLSSNTTRFLVTHALPKGIYLIEIKQGINHVIRRILVP